MADVASDLIALYQQYHLEYIVYVVAIALFCYDYCLTLGREVRLVWKRRFSASSILYYTVRYSAVFNVVLFVMDMTPWKGMSDWPYHSCGILVHMDMFFDVVVLIGAAVFSALRVFALWNRNPWIFSGVLFLGMVIPVISIYTFAQMQIDASTMPFPSCSFYSVITESVYENATELMLEWYSVLLIVNVIGLGLARRLEVWLIEPVSTWIALVTTIFTSRFILDLHEVADALVCGDTTQASEPGSLPSIAFRTHPNRLSRDLTHTQGSSRSLYGATLTHVTAVDDWDEPQDGPEDTDVTAGSADTLSHRHQGHLG
ncbi:hypothetical protein C8Q73DRAFT_787183 [Cubamyces lactineus]|nr:hypothetical protein C8Q73DRAFT_787183 [Cubamyces lactineus]